MYESSPDCFSFRFNHPKLLEITVERLYVHGSTCAPHEDDQFDCPSYALSFCLLCYCFKAFDQDIYSVIILFLAGATVLRVPCIRSCAFKKPFCFSFYVLPRQDVANLCLCPQLLQLPILFSPNIFVTPQLFRPGVVVETREFAQQTYMYQDRVGFILTKSR